MKKGNKITRFVYVAISYGISLIFFTLSWSALFRHDIEYSSRIWLFISYLVLSLLVYPPINKYLGQKIDDHKYLSKINKNYRFLVYFLFLLIGTSLTKKVSKDELDRIKNYQEFKKSEVVDKNLSNLKEYPSKTGEWSSYCKDLKGIDSQKGKYKNCLKNKKKFLKKKKDDSCLKSNLDDGFGVNGVFVGDCYSVPHMGSLVYKISSSCISGGIWDRAVYTQMKMEGTFRPEVKMNWADLKRFNIVKVACD